MYSHACCTQLLTIVNPFAKWALFCMGFLTFYHVVMALQVLSEALGWMSRAVEEFGLVAFNTQVLLGWAKEDLANTNAPVRNAAVALLATCHRQLGPGLAALVQNDVKPAQWSILEEAFAANPQQQVHQLCQSSIMASIWIVMI